ncbi:hypothetical protein PybrP1_001139 [[Pythium] brassicae (nom. inval.)]|nr:hypothetical protein PybrP1_001139 [[Pythium] brassicae (nom. inval.)]
MEDAVLVLAMLFVLVMSSYMLDRYSCMLVSQSGFALVFGLSVGLLLLVTGKRESLSHHLNLDNTLFFDVLLPPIIYEGGFSIKRQTFFRNFPAIMSTAVLGTVVATCVTGGVLFVAGRFGAVPALSWVEAFLFGALISAVDPVATLACFNKLNAPPLLFNLVFGESVLNDAVAIALYQTLLKWKPDIGLSAQELLSVTANTGGMFVGSLLVSALITLLGAFLLKREALATLRFFPTYEISLCLIFSLLTYFVAEGLNLSGIVSLFFSGTMTAHYHFHTISTEAQHSFTHLLHTTAFICENIVYVFMGTSVIMLFAGHVDKDAGAALRVDDLDWTFILLTLAACLAARFCNIFPLLGLSNCFRSSADQIPTSYMTAIWFAGLRGSIAFALAKNWSYVGLQGKSHRKLVESTTLMVVLFTTIVVGGLTGPLLAVLGLADKGEKDHTREELESDTGSSSGSAAPSPAAPAPPRLQIRHVPRRSMHYIVSHGVPDQAPFVEVPTSESTATTLDLLGRDAVLTPRPQMVDSDSDDSVDDSDVWGQSLQASAATHPPGIQRAASTAHRESATGAFFRSWQTFDASYLQPIFGGHSQQLPAATVGAPTPRMSAVALQQLQAPGDVMRARSSSTQRELAKAEKAHVV